jgi:Uma2 family endonuclease
MAAKLAEADQVAVEEFLAFYEARPNGEKWELIEGIAVMSPAPTEWHQVIAGNLTMALGQYTLTSGLLFKVLSKSNTKADQAWRRRVYASVPNCQHYVTIATRTAEVNRYDRASGSQGTTMNGTASALSLPAIDFAIPLSTIYRWTTIT